jgi:hypothetical protein
MLLEEMQRGLLSGVNQQGELKGLDSTSPCLGAYCDPFDSSFGASALLLGFPTGAPFQAAILESGAPGGVPIVTASSKDTQYERVLESTHCTSDPNHLSCLRSVAWKDLLNISVAESSRAMQPAIYARGYYAWTGVLDGGPSHGGFFADRPSQVINRGSFAHVPILHGDCLDEGTYFVPTTFNDSATFTDWISSEWNGSDVHSMWGNLTHIAITDLCGSLSLLVSTLVQESTLLIQLQPTQSL